MLLERAAELAALGRLLDDAGRGSGGVALIEGEAGIGKTALLDAAAVMAGQRGSTVLRARGGELERDLPFGVVRQLFETHLRRSEPDRHTALLAGPAAAAVAVLGLGAAPADPDPFAVLHGLYWLVDGMAAQRPVLLVVDDVQWIDPASGRWLAFVSRRLDGLRVAVVAGRRTGEPDVDAVEAVRSSAAVLRPSALSRAASTRAARAALGPDADDAFCAACHDAGGGNPFLLGRLLLAAADAGLPPTASSVGAVRTLGPRAVADSVSHRVGRLPTGATRIAHAVAVLGPAADLAPVAALAELDLDETVELAAELQRALVLDDGLPLRFLHPLLRAAVYADLPAARRGALHAAAARMLDVEAAATHLVVAPPLGDPVVVARLREAARRALARGSPEAATDLLARALAEPPPPTERGRVLFELGRAERLAGRAGAAGHLAAAVVGATTPDDRESAVTEHVNALVWEGRTGEALPVLEREIGRIRHGDPQRVLRLRALLVGAAGNSVDHIGTLAPDIVDGHAGLTGADPAERRLLAVLCGYHVYQARMPLAELRGLADRAWSGGRLAEETRPDLFGVAWPVVVHALSDDLERAEAMAELLFAVARRQGGTVGPVIVHAIRGWVRWRAGRLADAEADLRVALRGSLLAGLTLAARLAGAYLVQVLVHRGDPASAAEVLAEVGGPARTMQGSILLRARADLHLALGRPEDAHTDGAEVLARYHLGGSRVYPIGARLTLACAEQRLGRPDRARGLVDEELAVARDLGYASAAAAALRARGVLDRDLVALTASVVELESGPCRLELATSLVELGALLRRSRRAVDAREPLRRGLDLADRCGAAPLAERARGELLAAGGRPRRTLVTGIAALTPTERRVAALAAAGRSNPAIAQSLFVTRKTVEAHLAATYRKLGICSRADLPPDLDRAP